MKIKIISGLLAALLFAAALLPGCLRAGNSTENGLSGDETKEKQMEHISSGLCYSVRADVNEIQFEQMMDRSHGIFSHRQHQNVYTGQIQEEYAVFTEEDKAVLRHIIDNSYLVNSVYVRPIQEVFIEEPSAYFAGDKTAEDTARTIQQRLEIYLGEQH